MANYTYTCIQAHEQPESHSMKDNPVILCIVCGDFMQRKPPQSVGVNWGGLPPSEADKRSPEIKQYLSSRTESRARYDESKARINNE